MAAKTSKIVVGVGLEKAQASELRKIAKESRLSVSDLIRVGIKRVTKEYADTGSIQVGKPSCQCERQEAAQ